jgi:hypothetical protein
MSTSSSVPNASVLDFSVPRFSVLCFSVPG